MVAFFSLPGNVDVIFLNIMQDYYMANPDLGKSLCFDWFFLGQDFAVRTVSTALFSSVGFPWNLNSNEKKKKLTSVISIAWERCLISAKGSGGGEIDASRETRRKRGTQGAPSVACPPSLARRVYFARRQKDSK